MSPRGPQKVPGCLTQKLGLQLNGPTAKRGEEETKEKGRELQSTKALQVGSAQGLRPRCEGQRGAGMEQG